MRTSARALWLIAVSLWLASAASAVTIDWVAVGSPGNLCDAQSQSCFGTVATTYQISKYEVTNAQYAEFLNAKAASDPLALYDAQMGSGYGGITQSGGSGSYTYTAITGRADLPVNFVTFYDALRFTNWLANGQGSGDTESGSYTLLGGTPTPTNGALVVRNPGATIFLPNENEWYKAAYYDALSTSYLDYPAGSNTATSCTGPTAVANSANCDWPLGGGPGDLTLVGSYTGSPSPYGTYDQGGNVWEWTETSTGLIRVQRGGSFLSVPVNLAAATQSGGNPEDAFDATGFRLAAIPEPGTGVLVIGGVLGLAGWRRRRAD